MVELKATRDSFVARRDEPDVALPTDLPWDPPGKLALEGLAGASFIVGDRPGEFHYEINGFDD